MNETLTIQDENLSLVWVSAIKQMIEHKEIAPLVVIVTGFENGIPNELPEVRNALDQKYVERNIPLGCLTVANTIFPNSLWNENLDRANLFERYKRMLPRLRRYPGNRYGLYFERLIAHGNSGRPYDGENQLDKIISNWKSSVTRRTALQATIFDPKKDLAPQKLRGFPCLDHVSFAPQSDDGLSVTGYYTLQYIFERAYGNYLGLCNLGRFMAHEMGLNLTRMTCIANIAARDAPVYVLQNLMAEVDQILNSRNQI